MSYCNRRYGLVSTGQPDRIVRFALGGVLALVGDFVYAGFVPPAFFGIDQVIAAVVVFLPGGALLVTGATET